MVMRERARHARPRPRSGSRCCSRAPKTARRRGPARPARCRRSPKACAARRWRSSSPRNREKAVREERSWGSLKAAHEPANERHIAVIARFSRPGAQSTIAEKLHARFSGAVGLQLPHRPAPSCSMTAPMRRSPGGRSAMSAEHHLVVRLARRDHREAVFRSDRRRQSTITGLCAVEHLAGSPRRARRGSSRAHALGAEGFRQLDEIRQRLGVAFANSGRHAASPATGAPCPSIGC